MHEEGMPMFSLIYNFTTSKLQQHMIIYIFQDVKCTYLTAQHTYELSTLTILSPYYQHEV